MKILKWLLIALIVVPAIVVIGAYVRNKAIGPVGWAEDDTLKALRSKMKDPDSMIVRSQYVVQKNTESGGRYIYVCGVVDGKNSFGGYSGGARFASWSSSGGGHFDFLDVQIEDVQAKATAARVKMLSAFESVYWNSRCVDSAHPALTP